MMQRTDSQDQPVVLKTTHPKSTMNDPSTESPSGSSHPKLSRLKSGKSASPDKASIGETSETPLSVVKLTPLSMFFNNKVGSSFQDQRRALITYGSNGQQANPMTLPVTSRKVRDSGSLLFMFAFLGFLGYIIWDGIVVKEADIKLIVHGHDSYGNICGRNNKQIKFVDKSGQNFTSKPYTKYTLINAQFERYTLDTDRLKGGELYYIKQGDSLERSQRHDLVGHHGKITEQSKSRIKRSDLIEHELLRRNQSLLNSLKSNLMYHYPPMYGYTPSEQSTTPKLTVRSRLEHPRQKEIMSSGGTPAAGGNHGRGNGVSEANDAAIDQAEPSYAGTRRTGELATSTTQGPPRSTTLTVMFDDHANDSDSYEHMLVTPTNTNSLSANPRARFPDVLSQSEVSNQLLYLTECVDQCPDDHVELIFYRCMPKNWRFSLFPNAINVTRTFIDDIITDVTLCYRELIYIFSFALFLSIALLILLRYLASIIIWTCIALILSLFLSMASYSWINYYQQVIDLNNMMPHDSTYAARLSASDKWLIGSIFLTFISFAAIGMVIFMRKRILLVTKLFRESGKAIAEMPLLLLQPLLTFATLVTITAAWSVGLICLQSMKMPIIDMNTGFVVFKAEVLYKIMKWYHVFAFLWVSHFAIACQHYVIGASVSKWYFSPNRYDLHSPIGTSISELILYYLGSVALGSFLVAIFKVVRIVTRQIQYLVQRNCMSPINPNRTNGAGSYQLNAPQLSGSCCGSFSYVWRLFMWFFDNIVMIINRDAYVEIAIYGHSFLDGARRAFHVLATNPLRLLAIKSVSNVLLVVAKVCVVFGTVSVAVLLIDEKNSQLNYSWSPIVISALYAYIVAHWFLSVYEMVIDALFICYCEDYERSKSQETLNQVSGSNLMSQILNNAQLY